MAPIRHVHSPMRALLRGCHHLVTWLKIRKTWDWLFTSKPTVTAGPRRFRPQVEQLEDRQMPSIAFAPDTMTKVGTQLAMKFMPGAGIINTMYQALVWLNGNQFPQLIDSISASIDSLSQGTAGAAFQ